MSRLEVVLRGRAVGTLEISRRGGAAFRFAPDVVGTEPGSPLLSTALPVRAEPFDGEATRNWFTGLLPEDRQLDEVRRRFGLQSSGYFDILREIGWECAGAVLLHSEDSPRPTPRLEALSREALAERLTALPAHPYDEDDAVRVSLGGFQAKLLVTMTDAGWALPIGGAISTHILKPQPALTYPGMIAAEAWGMAVARLVTPTATTFLLGNDDAPVTLVVERFDRDHDLVDEATSRVHQEDACQALGLPPERKYAGGRSVSSSDPSLARIARLLERYARDPRAEFFHLAEQMVVNVALGNTDAHAKNYGIIHPSPGTITLSPMYDVVPVTTVDPGALEMGLRIDGTVRIDQMTGAKLVAEAASWGMGRRAAQRVVGETLERLEAAVQDVGREHPDADARLAERAQRQVADLARTI